MSRGKEGTIELGSSGRCDLILRPVGMKERVAWYLPNLSDCTARTTLSARGSASFRLRWRRQALRNARQTMEMNAGEGAILHERKGKEREGKVRLVGSIGIEGGCR